MICRSESGVRTVAIRVGKSRFTGTLAWPCHPSGFVLLVRGRGGEPARLHAAQLATRLRADGLGTLLLDQPAGSRDQQELHVRRLLDATEWLVRQLEAAGLPVGYVGIGSAAAVTLQAAALSARAEAVVLCGGRLSPSREVLSLVRVPTLFLEGDRDEAGLRAGAAGLKNLGGPGWLTTVSGAGPGWEETAALEASGPCAAQWLVRYLTVEPALTDAIGSAYRSTIVGRTSCYPRNSLGHSARVAACRSKSRRTSGPVHPDSG